jgi:septum site-determining protein MinC
MSASVIIKGSREGLRLQLDESIGWDDLLAALETELERGAQFFNGARVLIDVGSRAVEGDALTSMLELMRRHGLEADALIAATRESRTAARTAGIAARPVTRANPAEEQSEAGFVQRTLRSGQVLRHHGHLTIIGDINPGAEVIAGGSVVVWGRVRGIIHAGALGDRSAVICAVELAPTQLRIADLIARAPDGQTGKRPEIARVVDDQINVESWDIQRKA